MAGLACGDPSPLAWKILWDCTDAFLACPDYVAAKGMRVYGVPLSEDPFIVSGESGAVTLGALMFMMQRTEYAPLREYLQLGRDSQILLLNTERDTDPDDFRRVVWEGVLEYRRVCQGTSGMGSFDLHSCWVIPESGPHMVFVMMFANGFVPFSILLTSSIVTFGNTVSGFTSSNHQSLHSIEAMCILPTSLCKCCIMQQCFIMLHISQYRQLLRLSR